MALDKCKKEEIIRNDEITIKNPQVQQNFQVLNRNSLNYDFVQNRGDIYISFPDIMVWITKKNSMK